MNASLCSLQIPEHVDNVSVDQSGVRYWMWETRVQIPTLPLTCCKSLGPSEPQITIPISEGLCENGIWERICDNSASRHITELPVTISGDFTDMSLLKTDLQYCMTCYFPQQMFEICFSAYQRKLLWDGIILPLTCTVFPRSSTISGLKQTLPENVCVCACTHIKSTTKWQ